MDLIKDCYSLVAQHLPVSGIQGMLFTSKNFYNAFLPIFNLYRVNVLEKVGSLLLENRFHPDRIAQYKKLQQTAKEASDSNMKLECMRQGIMAFFNRQAVTLLLSRSCTIPLYSDVPLLGRIIQSADRQTLSFIGEPGHLYSLNLMHSYLSLVSSNVVQVDSIFLEVDAPCCAKSSQAIVEAITGSKSLVKVSLAFQGWIAEHLKPILLALKSNLNVQTAKLQTFGNLRKFDKSLTSFSEECTDHINSIAGSCFALQKERDSESSSVHLQRKS